MAKNAALGKAKDAKQDEFYTQLADIENELRHYRPHFKGKTILCNCDDPYESNFFKYFALNFNKLKLKKLIATCYAGSPITGTQLSLFGDETDDERRTPYKAVVTTVRDMTGEGGIDMCLRAEQGVRIAYKTTLKMMREMGISCGIRRETDYHRYNSYRGKVGKTFENVIGRDFAADGPWEKMGTDVTEFKQPWGKAYFAPVYDFGSKEIVAWSTSLHPNMAQQHELLDQLVSKKPKGSRPILHSDMGWQYQQAGWCRRLEEAGVVQSMSRKGNCIDNGATEQVFGHIKDEFFRGRTWPDFESFKADLDDFVVHWNTRRRQVKLKGLTPEEFRRQSLAA